MKIYDKLSNTTVSEITTNHSMTLDEAIALVGGRILNDEDEIRNNDDCNVIIGGEGYGYDWLELI